MIVLIFIGMMIVGGSLLWAANLIFGAWRRRDDDASRQVFTVLGWIFLFGGVVGAVVITSVWILPVVVLIAIMTVMRYRRSERRALAIVIAMATEHGIPLPSAIRAFADDANNEEGVRALRLADLLEAGVPLPDALRTSSIRMPLEIRAAVDYGQNLGAMGPALKRVINKDEFYELQREAILEKFAYLFAVVFFGVAIVTFLMYRIVPTFYVMFQDYELELPAITLFIVEAARRTGFVVTLFYPLMLMLIVAGILAYFRWLPTSWPVLGRLTLRSNVTTLLRLLSLTVERSGSIVTTIAMMSSTFPHSLIRRRLKLATLGMNQGQHWCDSLLQTGIFRPVDATVLKAAERAGNLAWAMNEIADSSLRRLAYRNAAALQILFPAALLAIGIIAGVIVIGLLMPLTSLIINLS